MQVTSTYRYARISAFKAREVTREIQGQSAASALDVLAFSPKKAAGLVRKTLKSAIANAENNAQLRVDDLVVKEAVVGEGPTFKRFSARARGSASPIRKRTSHIRIVLTDEKVVGQRGADAKSGQKTETAKDEAGTKPRRTTRARTESARRGSKAASATKTEQGAGAEKTSVKSRRSSHTSKAEASETAERVESTQESTGPADETKESK
ncbi:MAG: 50S ribosomal protein L22 [Verrucomicrobia bacterium]|nr:50S ribosomal protein L22 [Verrucomicrobiota bacterium]